MIPLKKFVRITALRNPAMFLQLTYPHFIELAYNYASQVWRVPEHKDYVDHGLDHSFQVLRKAFLILENILRPYGRSAELSDLERATLAVAAILHDTGMQWDSYVSDNERIGPEESRRFHVINGGRMLEGAMSGTIPDLPQLRDCVSYHTYLYQAGRIGFAHSGDDIWNPLMATQETHWNSHEQTLRFRMLAAALRLADEIDNDYTRIWDYEKLNGKTLKELAKSHWLACYYISEVRVEGPQSGLRITIAPRIPLEATPEIEDDILFLLRDYRLDKMNRERQRVVPYLRPEGFNPPVVEIQLVDSRRTAIMMPPSDTLRKLQNKQASLQSSAETAAEKARFHPIGHNDAFLDAVQTMKKAEVNGTLFISRHTALRSGWHCSRYYLFPRILGEGKFMEQVVRGLVKYYRNDNFDFVLGIGTAAVSL